MSWKLSPAHAGAVITDSAVPSATPTPAWASVSASAMPMTRAREAPTRRSTARRFSRPEAPSTAVAEVRLKIAGMSSAQPHRANHTYMPNCMSLNCGSSMIGDR